MKKLIFAAAFAVMGLSASAADGWVGGTAGIGFQSVKPDGYESINTLSLGITPEVGFYVAPRFGIAAEVEVDFKHVDDTNSTTVAVGPYLRYVFTDSSRANFFTELAGHYIIEKTGDADAIDGFNIQLRPGISVNIGKNWEFVGKIAFLEYAQMSQDGFKVSGFGIKLATSFSTGFVYRF